MKGQFELTETFIKFVQIALLIVGAMAIFFTYLEYEIYVHQNNAEKEALILGNSLISSSCLTNGAKGVITESKITAMVADSSCFNYPNGKIEIYTMDYSGFWEIELGAFDIGEESEFDVIIVMETNERKPGRLKVTL